MKQIWMILALCLIASCGKGSSSETKVSKLLSERLKNTYWEMPGYSAANLTIVDGENGSVALSASSGISNGTLVMLEESVKDNFVVFNIYTTNGNKVIGVSIEDPETIKVSVITSSNSLKGYKEFHDQVYTYMKKK